MGQGKKRERELRVGENNYIVDYNSKHIVKNHLINF